MEEYIIKNKRILPLICVTLCVTLLVTLCVTYSVTAGDLYTHFTYERNGNREVCFNSTTTSTTKSIKSYSWDFGDGSTSELENPCHVYDFWSPQRDYIVFLTVTDIDGVESTHSMRITASNTNIYMAFGIILAVGVFAVGTQWKARRVQG